MLLVSWNVLYREMAGYYDLLYGARGKSYRKESTFVESMVRKYGNGGKLLLDVGCGTGSHMVFLKEKFKVAGIDLSNEMLAIARRKLHGARLLREDMRNFKLHQTFDVITCLFSTINYNRSEHDYLRTFRNFASHLNYGGIAIIELFLREGVDAEGRFSFDTFEKGNVHVGRMGGSRRDGNLATVIYAYVVKKGRDTAVRTEQSRMGVYSSSEIKRMAEQAGFRLLKLDRSSRNPFGRSYLVLKKV